MLGHLPAMWDLVGLERVRRVWKRSISAWCPSMAGERPAPSVPPVSQCCCVALGYRCKSKRRCFAPAAFYKPFGEEAAGALTLSQFQALQENNKETASLRELGLSDSEILLWKNQASTAKVGVLCLDVNMVVSL